MDKDSSSARNWLIDELADLVLVVERPSLVINDVGSIGLRRYGFEPGQWIGCELGQFLEVDPAVVQVLASGVSDDESIDRREATVLSADGTSEVCLATVRMISEDRAILSAQPLSDFRRSRSRVSDLMHLASLTRDIFVVTDEIGTITYVNEAARLFHGDQKFIGRPVADFAEPSSWAALMERVAAGETSLETRILGLAEDGSLTPLSMRTEYDPNSQRWYTVERDISDLVAREDEAKRLVGDLRQQAMSDSLTGLANRAAFRSAVEQAILDGAALGILMLDMDDFKSVNDTLGHAVGDQLLIEVASRIRQTVPAGDLVARLGGDEFVVLGFGVTADELMPIAERILKRVSEPFPIAGCTIQRGCSIGGATWEPGDSYSDIMLRADRAAYRAKHAGRSRFSFDNAGRGRDRHGRSLPMGE